jgi:nitrate reductase gamma subunit
MTIFLVFPFTRLVHVWSAPVWYLGRPGYQVVRTRSAKRPAAKVSPVRTAVQPLPITSSSRRPTE